MRQQLRSGLVSELFNQRIVSFLEINGYNNNNPLCIIRQL